MTRSTDTLRSIWAPACQGPFAKVTLYGGGVVVVDPLIVLAVKALDACLRAYTYEATAPDVGAYNCRPITGGTKYSLHAYGIALDINWQANPYGKRLVTDMPEEMRAAIKGIRTNGGAQVWRWGGDYAGNKDAMHYEVVASPGELAQGIDPSTIPGGSPAPSPQPEDDDMPLLIGAPGAWYLLDGGRMAHLEPGTAQKFKTLGCKELDLRDDQAAVDKLKRDFPPGVLIRKGDTTAKNERDALIDVIAAGVDKANTA